MTLILHTLITECQTRICTDGWRIDLPVVFLLIWVATTHTYSSCSIVTVGFVYHVLQVALIATTYSAETMYMLIGSAILLLSQN